MKESDSHIPTNGSGNEQSEKLDAPPYMTDQGPGMSSWPGEPQSDGLFGDTQLMGLGINEALPPFEVMEELYETPTHHEAKSTR